MATQPALVDFTTDGISSMQDTTDWLATRLTPVCQRSVPGEPVWGESV